MKNSGRKITTVRGEISAEAAGITLVHEHLLFDARCLCRGADHVSDAPVTMDRLGDLRRNPLGMLDNLVVHDVDFLVDAIGMYRQLGGRTLVDVTPPEIGRAPAALRVISERSDVQIVLGSTHYLQLSHEPSLETETVEEITERLLRELKHGVGDTGIRPGILGEVGTSNPIHPNEKKVLRAVARASAETGLAITLHMDPTAQAALEVLEVLESEGADLSRVVVGHLDASINQDGLRDGNAVGYIMQVMERGAFVALDTFGEENWYGSGLGGGAKAFMLPNDEQRVRAVLAILEKGKIDQLLISQDACMKMSHVKYGGFGYGYILKVIVPQLRALGVSAGEIQRILVDNPTRMLAH